MKQGIAIFSLVLLCCLPIPTFASNGGNCPEGLFPDCNQVCGGTAIIDECGVCDGKDQDKDDCGVCFGNNKDKDDCGICFGNNENKDSCGVCFGNDLSKDCSGQCYGGNVLECGYCLPPGQGCKELCRDIVAPEYYREGLYAGCLPTACHNFTYHATGHWAAIAHSCPGVYAVSQGTLYINNGLHCGCIRKPDVGCFPPEAKINTPQGERRIDSLRAGDLVLNPLSNQEVVIKRVVQSPEKKPLVEFGFASERVRVTQTHPVYTSDGIKKAIDLTIGDKIQGADGAFHEVTAFRLLEPRYGQQVFNLILDTPLASEDAAVVGVAMTQGNKAPRVEDNLILSDGIVTGDMVLQALLNQE